MLNYRGASRLLSCTLKDYVTHLLLLQTTVCYHMMPLLLSSTKESKQKSTEQAPVLDTPLPACACVLMHVPVPGHRLSFASCLPLAPTSQFSAEIVLLLCALCSPSSAEGRWFSNCLLSMFPLWWITFLLCVLVSGNAWLHWPCMGCGGQPWVSVPTCHLVWSRVSLLSVARLPTPGCPDLELPESSHLCFPKANWDYRCTRTLLYRFSGLEL